MGVGLESSNGQEVGARRAMKLSPLTFVSTTCTWSAASTYQRFCTIRVPHDLSKGSSRKSPIDDLSDWYGRVAPTEYQDPYDACRQRA